VFLDPDSILLLIERIVDEVVERCAYMQMTKKGEQLFKNVKDSAVL
jgi:DNA-binding MarR family transcriptional regulator